MLSYVFIWFRFFVDEGIPPSDGPYGTPDARDGTGMGTSYHFI